MGPTNEGIYLTEKGSSFNYKGNPKIPRLSPERIKEITETNFEIKYQKHENNNFVTSHKDNYTVPKR